MPGRHSFFLTLAVGAGYNSFQQLNWIIEGAGSLEARERASWSGGLS